MKDGLFQNIITAVFPDRCLFCGNVTKPGEVCCGKCADGLPLLEGKRAAIKPNDPFSFVAAPFEYKDGVRRAIGQLKFHGHKEAGEFFAAAMLDSLDAGFRPDWVVSVPMNPDRLAERGYNQADLLALPIAEMLGCSFRPNALVRTGNMVQHELSASLRRLEAETSFQLSPGTDPCGRRILLVDDVFTTGSTLRRCAWLLRDAGAAQVACVVAAATPAKR